MPFVEKGNGLPELLPAAEVAEEVVRRLWEVRERHALDAPVVLLVRRGDDAVIFADEGTTPQTEGCGLRQRAGLIAVDSEGADELIIKRLRGALAHLLIEVAIGLATEHVPVEALTILLGQPLEGLMEEGFGDAHGVIDLVARASKCRTRDDTTAELLVLSEEAIGCPDAHRPSNEANLTIGREVKVKRIGAVVPEEKEVLPLGETEVLYGDGAKRPAIEVEDEAIGRRGGGSEELLHRLVFV